MEFAWTQQLLRASLGGIASPDRQSSFVIGVDRTRISCGALWGHRTACGFPRRKPHIAALNECRAAGNRGSERAFRGFLPRKTTPRDLYQTTVNAKPP